MGLARALASVDDLIPDGSRRRATFATLDGMRWVGVTWMDIFDAECVV